MTTALKALLEAPTVYDLIAAWGDKSAAPSGSGKARDPRLKVWADAVRATAQEWKDDHKRDYPDDADMRKGGREDAADMNKIATMIATGKLKAAKSAIAHLDTVVREQIPQQVWDGLGMSDY